jgi:hypothetical protein
MIGVLLFLWYANHYDVRVYSINTRNRWQLHELRNAFLVCQRSSELLSNVSRINNEFSWRVYLLPYFGIDNTTILSGKTKTCVPSMYSYYTNHQRDGLFLMIQPPRSDKLPVIIGVKKVTFSWIENYDTEFFSILSTLTPNQRLYDISNDIITLCDSTDAYVLVLAPDEEIYFIPTSTTIATFKNVIDENGIKKLKKKKKGILTYFY